MKDNKNLYESPKATLVCLDTVDVITTSPVFTDPDLIPDGWIEV